jgi:hypothetical protein
MPLQKPKAAGIQQNNPAHNTNNTSWPRFVFANSELAAYVSGATEASSLPIWARALAEELRSGCEVIEFVEGGYGGGAGVTTRPRTAVEVGELYYCALAVVDAATGTGMFGSGTFDFGFDTVQSFVDVFEGWSESSAEFDGPYVGADKLGIPATPGNLCAAIGLCLLDRINVTDSAMVRFHAMFWVSAFWSFAATAKALNSMSVSAFLERQACVGQGGAAPLSWGRVVDVYPVESGGARGARTGYARLPMVGRVPRQYH